MQAMALTGKPDQCGERDKGRRCTPASMMVPAGGNIL